MGPFKVLKLKGYKEMVSLFSFKKIFMHDSSIYLSIRHKYLAKHFFYTSEFLLKIFQIQVIETNHH